MTCPHCAASLTWKERAWRPRSCRVCKKKFAFEPRASPLRLTDVRFRKVAERLGTEGRRFTIAQLRTVLSAKAAPPAGGVAGGCLIAFCFAGALVGFALLGHPTLGDFDKKFAANAAPVFLGAGLLLSALHFLLRPKSMTDERFRIKVLNRWRAVHGDLPKGLVDQGFLAALPAEARPRDNLAGVIVCPERGVLDCLLANDVPRSLRLGLLPASAPADEWETSVLALLQRFPSLPVLLLHDASAEGVFLARDLPRLLGLDAAHRIYDLGLNPKKSIVKNRKVHHHPVPRNTLFRLNCEPVGVDVAGSRPIRRGRAQVLPEEMAWLMAGNCAPILAVPPASLIKRLKFALGKLASMRKAARPEGDAAAATGFMSWPSP